MKKAMKKDERREEIRQDLLAQLERNGTVGKFYTDLVEDYMGLYDIKTGLFEDIRDRGEKVPVVTAAGMETGKKTNDSVPDLLKVSAQMLKIMDSLGLDTDEPTNTGGDGDGEADRL